MKKRTNGLCEGTGGLGTAMTTVWKFDMFSSAYSADLTRLSRLVEPILFPLNCQTIQVARILLRS